MASSIPDLSGCPHGEQQRLDVLARRVVLRLLAFTRCPAFAVGDHGIDAAGIIVVGD
jgi:hypothetical protein